MNVLITGHKGFVGTHFIKKFSSNKNTNLVGIDIKDGADCRDFFKKDDSKKGYWDLVIHLAAIIGGRQKIENDPIAVATDLSIDAEMFNWAVRKKPRKIMYYSSSAAYPINLQTEAHTPIKLKEEDIVLHEICNPDLTYGWAKLTGEILAEHARNSYGLDICVLRPFSGYGPNQDMSYPFPSFIDRAKKRNDPFEIWGDGTQVRDFIHIQDIVDATLTAIKQDIAGPINLGSSRPISFNELAQLITQQAGYNPQLKHLKNNPVGVHYRVADNSKMLEFYQPKITLEEGIKKALND